MADLFFKMEENQSMTLSSAENSLKPLLTKQKKKERGGNELWFNTTIRDEFTVLFRRVLLYHKQADNHTESNSQLALSSLTEISVHVLLKP